MNKNMIHLLLIIALSACNDKNKFDELRSGMQSSKVISLVGEPQIKTPIFTGEWWIYNNDNKLIIINNDTVVSVKQDLKASQDSMKAAGIEMKQMLDSIDQ